MRIFITGGAGFIGKNLVPALSGHELLCLSHSQKIESGNQDLKIISGDLNNSETNIDELESFKPDCCIHLAWYGLPNYSVENSTKNLLAGIGLIENLVNIGCKKIFIAGSCWEYGNAQGEVKESHQLVQPDIFASFTSSLQLISESICKESSTNLLWGRIFFVYGPGQRNNSLIPSCYKSLKNSEKLKIKDPLARNDFIYISDVVESIRKLVESEVNSGVYNIGSGSIVPVWEVVNLVAAKLGLPQPYKDMPTIAGGNWANMNKMKLLNWMPKFSIESGVSNTIKSLEESL